MKTQTLTIAGISSVLTLIAAIVTGWIFVDERHAHAKDLEKLEQSTLQSLKGFQKAQVVNQLNQLTVKEQLGEITKYDKVLKEQLELELKLLVEDK